MAKEGWNDGGEVVAIHFGYGVGKKAAVALAILALLPIALPSLCVLSFFGFWFALPLGLLFLLFKTAFLRNSRTVASAEDIFLSDARAASEIMMRAIGEEVGMNGSNGQGVRIEPPAPETQANATHETHTASVGKGKDKVEEIDCSKAGVDRHSPERHSHSPGGRDGNRKETVPFEVSVASPSSNSPINIFRAEENSQKISPVLNDRADSASLEPVSEAMKEPKTKKHLEAATAEAADLIANGDHRSSSPAQSNGQTAVTASTVKGTPTHDHKKKAKHHPHHHPHHHKG